MATTSTSKAAPAKTAKPARRPATKAVAAPEAERNAAVRKPAKAPAVKSKPAPSEKTAVKSVAVPKPELKESKESKEKPRKVKLVRDSFTMPEAEYAVLGDVKKACLKAGIEVKKSELLRVGVALIRQIETARLKEILASLPTLKAGRPKKSK